MESIPWPELALALVVGLIATAVRALWRSWRAPARPAEDTVSVGPPARHGKTNERVRAKLIASCVILIVISIPHILELVPPNGVYGFRTGKTMSSPAIWYSANAFMGWALLVAAVAGGTLQIVLPGTVKRWLLWAAFIVPISGAIGASFVYLAQLQ